MEKTLTKKMIEETKKYLGYTEEITKCEYCKYAKEIEGALDRSWEWICEVSNLGIFNIEPHARCNKFEKKKL